MFKCLSPKNFSHKGVFLSFIVVFYTIIFLLNRLSSEFASYSVRKLTSIMLEIKQTFIPMRCQEAKICLSLKKRFILFGTFFLSQRFDNDI